MTISESKTTVASVSEVIRQKIQGGCYKPHEFIREASVAQELAVSRTPVREALRALVSEGWLEAIPNRGCRVAAWTQQDAREVFDIRLVLEPMAVGLACHRIDADTLNRLDSLCRSMEVLTEKVETRPEVRNQIAALNLEFHQAMVNASGNSRLIGVLESLVRSSLISRNFANYDIGHLRRSMRHHAEILQAVRAGNQEWVENIMRAHLLAARTLHMDA